MKDPNRLVRELASPEFAKALRKSREKWRRLFTKQNRLYFEMFKDAAVK